MRGYPIGTVRSWNGVKYRKTTTGWKPISHGQLQAASTKHKPSEQHDDDQSVVFSGSVEQALSNEEIAKDVPKKAREFFSRAQLSSIVTVLFERPSTATYSVDDDEVLIGAQDPSSTLVHELAHAYHVNKNIISGKGSVSREMQLCVREAHVDIDYHIPKQIIDKAKTYAQLRNRAAADSEDFEALLMLMPTLESLEDDLRSHTTGRNLTEDEVSQQVSILLDMLAACSNGNVGGGHSKKYWNRITKSAELFAHAMTIEMFDMKELKRLFPHFTTMFKQTFIDDQNQ